MKKPLYIVFNPVSGNHSADETKKIITTYLKKHTYPYVLHITKKGEDVQSKVKHMITKGYTTFVAVGGDGTIAQVAGGIYKTNARLAVIPTGSANTLAREMGIPLDIAEACEVLMKHNVTDLDVMLVNDVPHVIDVSIGINALTMRDTKRKHKRIFGIFAYLMTAAKWMIGYQPRRFTIHADDVVYSARGSEVLIANGGILKNLLVKVVPEKASAGDKTLDVIIVRASSISDYAKILWYLIVNKKTKESQIDKMSVYSQVTVESNKVLPVQADGEIIGNTPVTVYFKPSAIRMLVPSS